MRDAPAAFAKAYPEAVFQLVHPGNCLEWIAPD
jgi:hypothetical protein